MCKYPVGVEGWMKEFATANTIFTDSFHGTVLSLIFNKQFVVYVDNPRRATRIISLLTNLGLQNRVYMPNDKEKSLEDIINSPIDYQLVNKILCILREKSWELLRDSIN